MLISNFKKKKKKKKKMNILHYVYWKISDDTTLLVY